MNPISQCNRNLRTRFRVRSKAPIKHFSYFQSHTKTFQMSRHVKCHYPAWQTGRCHAGNATKRPAVWARRQRGVRAAAEARARVMQQHDEGVKRRTPWWRCGGVADGPDSLTGAGSSLLQTFKQNLQAGWLAARLRLPHADL